MKSIIITLICIAVAPIAMAQFNFVFQPELYGKSIDGLGVFQIQNLTGRNLIGTIAIDVRETRTKTNVGRISFVRVNVQTGISSFSRANFANAAFAFSDNNLAGIVSQSRNFPPGEYSYCYRFVSDDKNSNDEYETCFDGEVLPTVPISLVNPDDKDRICQKRPALSWLPPVPFSASIRFRLILSEKKKGAAIENLITSNPIILLNNISASMIAYPSTSPDLQEGKTYCWQVEAYDRGLLISTSEIWEFTVECKEAGPQIKHDSYRELKSMVNGNYYIANEFFKFSFFNSYNLKKLNYDIIDVKNGMEKIRHIPEVTMKPGLNNIDIDLSDLDLEENGQYILRVYPFNELMAEVRFVYKP